MISSKIIKLAKPVSLILTLSLLACGGSVHKGVALEQYDLSLSRAMNIDWSEHKIKLVGIDGSEQTGYLDGWTETGFIIEKKNHVDTLAYDKLRGYVILHAGKSLANKGFRYGLAGGVPLAAFAGYLILKSDNDDDNTGLDPLPPDDNPTEDNWRWALAIISVPAILAASAGIGALIGSTSDKYERYYYKADEFKSNPWLYKSPEIKTGPVDDLP